MNLNKRGQKIISITLDEDEYNQMLDDNQGICLSCGEIRDSTEGDAKNYECESCGECKVQGIMNLLFDGSIIIGISQDDYINSRSVHGDNIGGNGK